jgi:hypothetical protein
MSLMAVEAGSTGWGTRSRATRWITAGGPTERLGTGAPHPPQENSEASAGAVTTHDPALNSTRCTSDTAGDSLNGVCAPRRGRMLACQVRRSATWVTRPWAFRGRFISRAMWLAQH